MIKAWATALVFALTTSASVTTGLPSSLKSVPGGRSVNNATSGSTRKLSAIAHATKNASATSSRRIAAAYPPAVRRLDRGPVHFLCFFGGLVAIFCFGFTSGKKPNFSSCAWPALLRTSFTKACACAWLGLFFTTAMA